MTMKRYINLLLAFCVSALTLQSCFQDMDHPALIIRIVLLPKCSHQ